MCTKTLPNSFLTLSLSSSSLLERDFFFLINKWVFISSSVKSASIRLKAKDSGVFLGIFKIAKSSSYKLTIELLHLLLLCTHTLVSGNGEIRGETTCLDISESELDYNTKN